MIQSGFELLLELTGYGILLARDMKKSEVAVGDLSRQVKPPTNLFSGISILMMHT